VRIRGKEESGLSLELVSGNNQKLDVPPSTNRGAQNTEIAAQKDGLVPCVDWVQATFKSPKNSAWEIIDLLGLPRDLFKESKGAHGWTDALRFKGIAVYYGGNPYFHIEMSGEGCRLFENLTPLTWQQVFAEMIIHGAKFTRVDLAIDDFKGYFSVKKLINLAKKGLCRSHFKRGRAIEEFDLDDGTEYGKTLYLGKGSSRIQVRFYDKREERAAKGYEILEVMNCWNRTEIQLRDERAQKAAQFLATTDEIGKCVYGILSEYCTFVVRDKHDSNKSRWRVQRFWEKFIGDVEPLRLAEQHPEPSLIRKRNWLQTQVSKTMFQMLLVEGSKVLEEIALEAEEKMTETDYEILDMQRKDYLEIIHARKVLKLNDVRAEKLKELRDKPYLDEYEIAQRDIREMEERKAKGIKLWPNKNPFADGAAKGTDEN
jgi:phage replication initiation protein